MPVIHLVYFWLQRTNRALPAYRAMVLAASLSASVGSQPLDPKILEDIGIDQRLDEAIPLDLSFVNAAGKRVTLDDYFNDRPIILALAYFECPMLCSQVLNGLTRALKPLSFSAGSEFDVIVVDIDPDESTELAAAKKAEYLHRYRREGAENGWHFLTGEQEQIDRITEAVGFRYQYDAETDNYIHASGIMVLTPSGQLSRYLYGVEYAPKDLRLALIESATERIGSPVDQLLLLCFNYDPESGEYNVAILNSLRIGGFAVLAAVGLSIVTAVRRDRRTRFDNTLNLL